MKPLVNQETNQDVNAYIAAVANAKRRADAEIMLQLIKEVTHLEPKIWGKSIIGFGKYKYKRKDGSEHEWFNVGFSPASAHTSVYLMYDVNEEQELLQKLGPHRTGKGCLYIKKVANVDLDVLKQLIAKSNRWS